MEAKQSLKDRILKYLEHYDGWVRKGQLEDKAKEAGVLAETLDRTLRRMEEDKLIQKSYYTGENGQEMVRYASIKKKLTKSKQIVEIIGRKAVIKYVEV